MIQKSSLLCLLRVLAGVAAGVVCLPAGGRELVKLRVERDGVYRVTESDLARAGFSVKPADVERLRLRSGAKSVPLRVARKGLPEGAGTFALDFVGRFPRGAKTREDEYNVASIYLLDLAPAGEAQSRYREMPQPGLAGSASNYSELRTHHEVNRKLMRFSGGQTPDEVWYWDLLMASAQEAKPFKIQAERVAADRPFKLRVHLMGYSAVPANPDHVVELSWNGTPLPEAAWDGQTPLVYERELPAGSLLEGQNLLAMRVTGAKTGGLDVVLVDWVQLDYTQRLSLARGQLPFNGAGAEQLAVDAVKPAVLTFFDENRATVQAASSPRRYTRPQTPKDPGAALADDNAFWAVRAGDFLSPAVSVARFEDLRAAKPADFVIVTDRELLPAANRLAAVRRAQGLQTLVVDVQDIYDNFSGSLLEPEAIRNFLKHAWEKWHPRPRYVLLFGDASWDYKNRNVEDEDYPDHTFIAEAWTSVVPKIPSEPLRPGDSRNDRLRVPTMQWQSPWGHAASDTYFARLDGEDALPDVALGRLTVGNLQEAEAEVDKILAYEKQSESLATPKALFITDQYDFHKSQSDRMANLASTRGFEPTKIYPNPEEKDNLGNSAAIRAAFDAGPSLVVFAGHGGRYIWRTGPPDPLKNHDLFTLEDLDNLQPAPQLPVVVSLTCYSAPFDHPTADSIGEKLMRLEHKGAIAILASSWRNVPPFSLAERLIETMGNEAHPRLGDAYLDSMRSVGQSDSLHTYNLLGDPSLRLPRFADPAPAASGPPQASPK